MLAATLLSVLSAVAAASPTLLTRAPFPIDAIPDVCSTPCKTYKSVFGADATQEARSTACQGHVFEQFNICMNCTSIEGIPNGMTSEQVQLLSLAVQQMGQECIDTHYTSQYAGAIPAPTSLPMSSSTTLAAPAENKTQAAATASGSANPFSSSAASGTAVSSPSASAPAAAEDKGKSGAVVAGASLSAALVAAGALALLV